VTEIKELYFLQGDWTGFVQSLYKSNHISGRNILQKNMSALTQMFVC